MSTPYTYLIGWSELDLWYYGGKFGKGADPALFWVNYFTSSKYVKNIRDEFGEPDVREIRKTFESKESAAEWERKVIRRLGAVKSNRWINMGNGGHEFNIPPEIRALQPEWASKISAKAKERFADPEWKKNVHDASHQTAEHRAQASIRTTELFTDETYRANHLAAVRSDEYRKKQGDDSRNRFADPETRKRHSDILKAANASPEARAKKSEAAKASTAKRLETRRRNAELASATGNQKLGASGSAAATSAAATSANTAVPLFCLC